eukprot:TRINITY_DN3497_c0_g1_i1.p1 TRINITY_DN3497_c0_g1~~TRINITY_DN3497_c0_g1_i1.p1  ORF type:complete len:259 (+),score=62.45 TRINITY_DN3497_c0_g1_i1:168-944(+)
MSWVYMSYGAQVGWASLGFKLGFHTPGILCLWAFYRAVFTDPGEVPEDWKVEDPHLAKQVLRDRSNELKANGELRYCRRCGCYKPDRTHHDSSSDRCVLKMDHRCPWINNSVGFANHKFFLLFVFYVDLCAFLLLATSGGSFLEVLTYMVTPKVGAPPNLMQIIRSVNFLMSTITCGLFCASLSVFLLFHLRLVANNTTTIELLEKSDKLTRHGKSIYDLGFAENFVGVFGDKWWLWLLPVYTTPGDGVYYPTQPDLD